MKSFLRIFTYMHIPKGTLALYIVCSLLATFFSAASLGMLSPFMQLIINGDSQLPIDSKAVGGLVSYIQQLRDSHTPLFALGMVCLIIVMCSFLSNTFRYLSYYISTPVRNAIASAFRVRMYDKVLQLPLNYFTEQRKGNIINRIMGDINEIEHSIIMAMEGLVKDPLTILFYLGYMVYLSPRLSLALLILLPVTSIIIGRLSKKLKKHSNAYSQASGENLSHIEETLGGIKVIKAFGAEAGMMKKFVEGNNKVYRVLNSMTRRRDLASPLTEAMGVLVLCCVLFIGGYLVFHQPDDLRRSDLFTFIALFGVMINPAKNLANTVSNIQRGLGAIDRIEEILQAPLVIEESPHPRRLSGFNHSIEFRNVTFKYGETVILDNINLVIPKGKTIALIGSSGAGKSTLVDLIPRFHDVTDGEVLIDGFNIREYSISSLRSQMSLVTQEPILFNDSIAQNIALGKPGANEEDIIQAARIANAHDFIVRKDRQYQENVGDRGNKLSGGERQRITIARAVLRNPPILILDEATSSLDTESERLVQDALNNLMLDRTSIVIAHRLSTVRNADEIIVLQKGKIIERGTHNQLVAASGFYRKLVDMQEIS